MTTPVAAWRVTYTPGDWLVLSGPTMLVVLLPAPARMSGLVNSLWDDVVSAGSVEAFLKVFSSYGLDSIPDFAAFFWDEEGLHGMARGDLTVVDVNSGEVVVQGAEMLTWREEALGTARQLRVGMHPVEKDAYLQLPLVVGAAMASVIELTTDPAARVQFPEQGHRGILDGLEPAAALAETIPPNGRASKGDDAENPVEGPEVHVSGEVPSPEVRHPGVEDPEAQGAEDQRPSEDLAEEDVVGLGDETDMEPYIESAGVGDGEDDEAASHDQPEVESEEEPELEATEDQRLQDGEDNGSEDPGVGGFRFDHDDNAALPPQPAATDMVPSVSSLPIPPPTAATMPVATTSAPMSEPQQSTQVWAEPCARGHANPRGARLCRICSAPVDPAQPRLIARPALACVRSNTGEVADLRAGIVVGRAPTASKAPEGAHLMRVPSPGGDISRSHLLVKPQDWNVIVTDLDSTNGTIVKPVGEAPFVLGAGASVQVDLGTILDLGDGVSLRIEPPQG